MFSTHFWFWWDLFAFVFISYWMQFFLQLMHLILWKMQTFAVFEWISLWIFDNSGVLKLAYQSHLHLQTFIRHANVQWLSILRGADLEEEGTEYDPTFFWPIRSPPRLSWRPNCAWHPSLGHFSSSAISMWLIPREKRARKIREGKLSTKIVFSTLVKSTTAAVRSRRPDSPYTHPRHTS